MGDAVKGSACVAKLACHCNTLQHKQHTATYCNTLQHTATHCNTLRHTATRIAKLPCRSSLPKKDLFATAGLQQKIRNIGFFLLRKYRALLRNHVWEMQRVNLHALLQFFAEAAAQKMVRNRAFLAKIGH